MKRVLVVVDVQNDFVDGALGSAEAQAAIANICQKITNFEGGLIAVTQDTHSEDYLATKEGRALPVVHCVEGSDGWRINAAVAEALGARNDVEVAYIHKPTFGSEELLQRVGDYTQGEEFAIEFVGFCTDICVLSNAIMCKARFYDRATIAVDASCCAGVTPEKHRAALDVISSCQIEIL